MRVIHLVVVLVLAAALIGGGFLLGRAYQAKQDASATTALLRVANDITTEAIDSLAACQQKAHNGRQY